MKLTNKTSLLLCFLAVIFLAVSFFGVFFFSEGVIRLHREINYWAYAYIASLALSSFVFSQNSNFFDKSLLKYKILVSVSFLISFFGLALGFVGTMDGTPGSLPGDNVYVAHYFLSSLAYNVVMGFKLKKLMRWFFFFLLIFNVIVFLWVIFIMVVWMVS